MGPLMWKYCQALQMEPGKAAVNMEPDSYTDRAIVIQDM